MATTEERLAALEAEVASLRERLDSYDRRFASARELARGEQFTRLLNRQRESTSRDLSD